jgi:hypothetical protein
MSTLTAILHFGGGGNTPDFRFMLAQLLRFHLVHDGPASDNLPAGDICPFERVVRLAEVKWACRFHIAEAQRRALAQRWIADEPSRRTLIFSD